MKYFLVSLVLFAAAQGWAQVDRQGYTSWRETENVRQESSKIFNATGDAYVYYPGSERNSEKFNDILAQKLTAAGVPNPYYSSNTGRTYEPAGYTPQQYRDAKAAAYEKALAEWKPIAASDQRVQSFAQKERAAENYYQDNLPKEAKIIQEYSRGGMVRPTSLIVLGAAPAVQTPQSEMEVRRLASMNFGDSVHRLPSKNIVLMDGSAADLKIVLDTIAKHPPGKQLFISLGLGYDSSGKSMGASTGLLKLLASNPEMINSLKEKGVEFSVRDNKTGNAYGNIKDYLRSDDWKAQNRKIAEARKQVDDPKFKAQLKELDKLDKEREKAKNPDDYKKIVSRMDALEVQTHSVLNQAYSETMASDLALELASKSSSPTAKVLVNGVNESIAASVEAEGSRKSGKAFDPKAAAESARRGAK